MARVINPDTTPPGGGLFKILTGGASGIAGLLDDRKAEEEERRKMIENIRSMNISTKSPRGDFESDLTSYLTGGEATEDVKSAKLAYESKFPGKTLEDPAVGLLHRAARFLTDTQVADAEETQKGYRELKAFEKLKLDLEKESADKTYNLAVQSNELQKIRTEKAVEATRDAKEHQLEMVRLRKQEVKSRVLADTSVIETNVKAQKSLDHELKLKEDEQKMLAEPYTPIENLREGLGFITVNRDPDGDTTKDIEIPNQLLIQYDTDIGRLEALYNKIDFNKDGEITQLEFYTALKKGYIPIESINLELINMINSVINGKAKSEKLVDALLLKHKAKNVSEVIDKLPRDKESKDKDDINRWLAEKKLLAGLRDLQTNLATYYTTQRGGNIQGDMNIPINQYWDNNQGNGNIQGLTSNLATRKPFEFADVIFQATGININNPIFYRNLTQKTILVDGEETQNNAYISDYKLQKIMWDVISPEHAKFLTEQVKTVPDSLQANPETGKLAHWVLDGATVRADFIGMYESINGVAHGGQDVSLIGSVGQQKEIVELKEKITNRDSEIEKLEQEKFLRDRALVEDDTEEGDKPGGHAGRTPKETREEIARKRKAAVDAWNRFLGDEYVPPESKR